MRPSLVALIVGLGLLTIWAFAPGVPGATEPGVRVEAGDAYNPVTAGETLPHGFRQLLPRDAIKPIYDPSFVVGELAGWPGDAEVIGVATEGRAKAYPISFLNGREMVLDEIGGDPILVSW